MRDVTNQTGCPFTGVFFFYDLSPIKVNIRERRASALSFATNLCAIVGGVSTVVAFVDWAVVRAKRLYC